MKKLTWKIALEKYPTLKKYGFDCYVMGGFSNYLFCFGENFDSMELDEIKYTIKKIKSECKKEIIELLNEYGLENNGKWFYCEFLELDEDGNFPYDEAYFGVSSFEDMGDNKTNFHENNIIVDKFFEDVKGL